MADNQSWFCVISGEKKGPFNGEQISALIASGTLDSRSMVWKEGQSEWMPAEETDLRTMFPDAAPPTPPEFKPQVRTGQENLTPSPSVVTTGRPLSLWGYFTLCLSTKYADFRGRARRAEYWGYSLFLLLFYIVAGLIAVATGPRFAPILILILSLGTILPSLAAAIRRLHDAGYSGWLILIGVIPFGSIVLLIFMIMPSERGTNRWGPVPDGVY